MKKSLYYRTVFRRDNILKLGILSLFYMFSSYPRLLLEVFIRKNFGERYFNLMSALTVAGIFAFWPWLSIQFSGDAWVDYIGWYAFLAVFIYLSLRHHEDQKRNPSVFDFKRFSRHTGKINPAFYKVQLPGIKTNHRLVECLIEPAFFFLAGIPLYLIGQQLGWLLMGCSIFYALSYVAAYTAGDHFVMDKIDEMIVNEELEKSFVDDADEEETRGFRFRGRKPTDKDMRRKILPLMNDDEEILTAE